MKLLWLSHFIPFPPRGGNAQRSYNLLRQASRHFDVHLTAFNLQGEGPERLQEYSAELRKFCASVEIWELPLRWKSARWWAELPLRFAFRLPFPCYSFWSKETALLWNRKLDANAGALVHIDAIDLAPFAGPAAGFRKVLNHHNCESAMSARRAALEPGQFKKAYLRSQAKKLARLEREICRQFDVNLTVSQQDAELLKRTSPHAHVHMVENGTDTEYFTPAEAIPEPETLIFAGSLNWYPNQSGVQFFLTEVWPVLKQRRPLARLYIAGQKPPEWMLRLAASSRDVTVVANPPDMRPLIARAAVVICPILDGGGTRLKILDALAMGKAVVSTTIGCQGLDVSHGRHILIADGAEAFAEEVKRVLADDGLRRALGSAGRALVLNGYSWDKIGADLTHAYNCALTGSCTPCRDVATAPRREHFVRTA